MERQNAAETDTAVKKSADSPQNGRELADLQAVIAAWPTLPASTKTVILKLID